MITCLGLAPALDITYGVAAVGLGRIHRPDWVLELAGGKAVNLARALRTLGVQAQVVVPLGGYNGTAVAQALAAEGIAATVVPMAANTRRCVTAVDAASGATTEFYEPAAAPEGAALDQVLAAVDELDSGWLAVSGSMPADAVAGVADALARAGSRGVRIAADLQGAALRAVLDRTRVELVKVNRSEAAELFGPAGPRDLALRLREAGAETAVVTDGAAGAVGLSADGAWRATPGERGRYAVGSGDSFLAGLLAGLSCGETLPGALARATSAAVANTRTPGAARCAASDVAEVAAGVAVRRLYGADS